MYVASHDLIRRRAHFLNGGNARPVSAHARRRGMSELTLIQASYCTSL